ncbi:MAG: tetratricopeptide repeat protein [Ruminococcus sp.]|nr:tetratricopeptide repeat protein [Ruminococcus sp.]
MSERLVRQTDSITAQINLYISYDNLGDIREKQDNLDNAKEYYKKSLFINERLADKLKTPIDDYNVACCYRKIGLLCTGKERAEWLNKAEKILQQLYELYYDEPLYAEMFEGMLEMVENDISKTEL